MSTAKFEIGKPMDMLTFKKFLRSGQIPVRVSGNKKGTDYDLKFFWRNKGNRFSSNQFRVYFGNYFQDSPINFESISIGPGTPYKTESIIVLLNPPIAIEKRFSINTKFPQNTPGKNPVITVGYLDSRAIFDLLIESAKEVGVQIRLPNRPSETMTMLCTLIPQIKDGVEDPLTCILQIDNIDYK